jgi:hypothetical protein
MTVAQLIEALKAQDLKPHGYSGRGMFGAECVGVSVKHPGDHALPVGWRQDQLGMDYIVYWPSARWSDSLVVKPEVEDAAAKDLARRHRKDFDFLVMCAAKNNMGMYDLLRDRSLK